MPSDPFDEFEGIDFTEYAGRQLEAIQRSNPSLGARLLAEIHRCMTAWSPGDEDGVTIKHVSSISKECRHNVYRLKYEIYELVERRWRVFFAFLSGRKPPIRLVLAVVDYDGNQKCYDDPSQPHRSEIRKAIDDAVERGETKKKKS